MSEQHVFFIWGAYGVTAICLVLEILFLVKRKRETKT
jgi:heme exporter protein CcmD